MPSVRELLTEAVTLLEKSSPSAALDARVLLEHASGIARLKLISEPDNEIPAKIATSYRRMLERRALHEPVAYITGHKDFYGAEFLVSADVLIPRPETELLIEKAIEFLKTCQGSLNILDLGTGSGCIAVTLAREMMKLGKAVSIIAVDSSEKALFVAQRNAKQQEVSAQIKFLVSDWFSALDSQQNGFDLIVSNPPYIAEGDERISPELRFEPAQALYSKNDGLSDISKILSEGPKFLKPQGRIIFETGTGQHAAIRALIGDSCAKTESFKDLAGHERVFTFAC